jgi:hypothetical protein
LARNVFEEFEEFKEFKELSNRERVLEWSSGVMECRQGSLQMKILL